MKRARRPRRISAKRKSLTSLITSCLRGGQSTADALIKIEREFMARPGERLGAINPFVAKRAFEIPEKEFGEALNIDAKHLSQLTSLVNSGDRNLETNYLQSRCSIYREQC